MTNISIPHSINRKIRKNISIHIQSIIVCHQVSQPMITAQVLLGLLAKCSLLFFGSQCLRAKRRRATRSCLAKCGGYHRYRSQLLNKRTSALGGHKTRMMGLPADSPQLRCVCCFTALHTYTAHG